MILNTFLVVLIGIFLICFGLILGVMIGTARLDRYCVEDQEDLKESLIQALAVEKYNFTKMAVEMGMDESDWYHDEMKSREQMLYLVKERL